MFILNGFSHHKLRSSWKSVLSRGKKRWRFVCLRVIQKPLLISSLVTDCVFRKASAFDMFEVLCETSKTIWSNWNWQLCSEHMALFSLLYNAGGMQIMPLVSCLSQFHIFYPVCFKAYFSPSTTIPSCLVSFWLSQWIAICFFTCFSTHYKKLKSISFQNNCFCCNSHGMTRTQKDVCFESSAFSRTSCVP